MVVLQSRLLPDVCTINRPCTEHANTPAVVSRRVSAKSDRITFSDSTVAVHCAKLGLSNTSYSSLNESWPQLSVPAVLLSLHARAMRLIRSAWLMQFVGGAAGTTMLVPSRTKSIPSLA